MARRYWFHPWRTETLEWHGDHTALVHTADGPFGNVLHRGDQGAWRGPISVGDVVFVGANVEGALVVAGGMVVGACTSGARAADLLRRWYGEVDDLWEAEAHVVAAPGSSSPFDARRGPLPEETARRLLLRRYDSNSLNHWRGLAIKGGRVDKQTLRTLCELDEASGRLLAATIGWAPPLVSENRDSDL